MTLGGLIGLKLLPSNLHKHKDRNSNLMGAPQPPKTFFFFAEYCTSSASTNQKTLYKKRTYNCQHIPPNYEGEARQPQRCGHVCVCDLALCSASRFRGSRASS